MRQTRVPPNVTRNTKLQGTQRSPELRFRSADFGLLENLIFPALDLYVNGFIGFMLES